MMIIQRPVETKRIKDINKWILVYGRRKTGKSFLVQNFIKFDEYFFIKTDRGILTKESHSINYDSFLEIMKRALEDNKTVVVDEFHRLGSDFFDFLHASKKQGKLILISSTLFLSKRLISGKSALLGLFAEVPIGLISLKDTLNALKEHSFSNKDRLELAILMREPISVDYIDEKKSAKEIISTIILSSLKTIPALVGEIFLEEEREISAIYEGILRGIAVGKIGSGEISSYLFSKKLIKKDDPSIIQQYLANLLSFGIIKRMEIYNKKRFVYKLISPLSKIYYYIDEKYNLSERKISELELSKITDGLMPRIIEDNIREHIAEKYGLKESIIEGADFDIDGYLLKFQKPEIILEVKWKKLKEADILKSEETLNRIDAPQKVLFVPDKKGISGKFNVMDVRDL